MNPNLITVDVREEIRNGGEPFSKIMNAVAQLRPDENLLLLAPFEPKPLFAVLAKQGFTHTAREIADGDWEVLFARSTGSTVGQSGDHKGASAKNDSAAATAASRLEACSTISEVDARGLEPPQPLVTILEALVGLPADAQLRARSDRRPMHLYAQLEERGFSGESEEQNDGSFITKICRR